MGDTLLVRYGELALKSPPVRREFEHRLKQNLMDAFLREGRQCLLSADHGHLYVQTSDAETAIPFVRRLFGITSVSVAEVIPTDVPAITAAVVRMSDPMLPPGTRFAVRARRTGSHSFTSQTLGADIGGAILDRYADRHLKVDLTAPEVELHVEVRGTKTYLYRDRVAGPGGLPLGVAGKVGAYVNGRRGALGAYQLMKRGCRVYPIASGDGVVLVQSVLRRFDPRQEEVVAPDELQAWNSLRTRAAEKHWDGVVLPLEVEDYGRAREFFGETVIFSPTVGLTDEEVESQWSAVEGLAR